MAQIQTWPYRRFLFVSIPLSLLSTGLLYVFFSQDNLTLFFFENGPVEHLQVSFLFLTTLFSLVAYLKSNEPLFTAVAFSICLFSVIFVVREVPTCGSSFTGLNPDICIARYIKRGITLSAVVALAARSIYVYVRQRNLILCLFHPRFCWPSFPFGICLLGSEISENYHLNMLEEALELNAYAMMLVISWQLLGHRS